jgi:hypothetical protein
MIQIHAHDFDRRYLKLPAAAAGGIQTRRLIIGHPFLRVRHAHASSRFSSYGPGHKTNLSSSRVAYTHTEVASSL